MAIPVEKSRELVRALNAGRPRILAAQTHAKHVLNEVNEESANFPKFDGNLDEKITLNAYAMLATGCSLIEQELAGEGAAALEQAATWLHEVHSHQLEGSLESRFHQLIAAMAFYAAGHYSRGYICLESAEQRSQVAGMIAAFIRKERDTLVTRLNGVLLADTPDFADRGEFDEWVLTVSIARALAWILEFFAAGDLRALETAATTLADAQIVAAADVSPGMWWVIRLLRLMLRDLGGASLWNVLPPHFDGDRRLLERYIRLMCFASPSIVELWTSQRAALRVALDTNERGAVINLRTSAGKTRVAELAILRTLEQYPEATVVYLAPFRSLAFELERALGATFSPLGYSVSHLYGGSRINTVDMQIAAESRITIATPEKARALMRAAPELFESVRLFVIDEGHLIGRDARDTRNEAFVDHVRQEAARIGARIILLSAVLPNTEELAEWIAGDPLAVARSMWKPSAERYGFLRWNGRRVALEWHGEVHSFNPKFVEATPTSTRKNSGLFPGALNQAVSATAVRLSEIGPVMIFTAQARMVPGFAEAAITALGNNPSLHPWPQHEWQVFEEVCKEELDADAMELRAARFGIICHSNRLTSQVRMATEQLMRSHSPRLIIATRTLGQGVNVGVSSVIVANTLIDKSKRLEKLDFWNICGRAGRAFVDGEGKILVAINEEPSRKRMSVLSDEMRARSYFREDGFDRVESGVLAVLTRIWDIARLAGVSFDVLVERIANDDRADWGDRARDIDREMDLLDDTLLAMHLTASADEAAVSNDLSWIEGAFRHSLAAIQARLGRAAIGDTGVIWLVQARAIALLRRLPNVADRRAVVASGLPMSVALRLRVDMALFRDWTRKLVDSGWTVEAMNEFVFEIEQWSRVHAQTIVGVLPDAAILAGLRPMWLAGTSLRSVTERNADGPKICREVYGFQLPWLMNAIAQQFDADMEWVQRLAVGNVALLVELGLPNVTAARIFIAGVKSRVSSTELATLPIDYADSISQLNEQLRDSNLWADWDWALEDATKRWLALLAEARSPKRMAPASFAPFVFVSADMSSRLLYARSLGGRVFLCSPDGAEKVPVVDQPETPFSVFADNLAYAFVFEDGSWRLDVRDPRIVLSA
ncbi:DEAD/DEAH box helicase (plasmid) [Cupriavidus basilensis]